MATAIVKMAEQGVYWASQEGSGHVPAYDVDVVDTISAGDAFSGGLAVAVAEGRSMQEAIRYASAAGALAVTVDDQDLYTIVITTYIPPRQVGDGPWTPWYADYYHPAV